MNGQSGRIALLARQPQAVFHSRDLARLWGIDNSRTLNVTLNRYANKGLLFRIYKGLYSFLPVGKLGPFLIGLKALHGYGYVSTETILVENGLITQMDYKFTLVSGLSRNFKIGGYVFKSRQLADQYLYNTAGVSEVDGILKASPLRALADMFYFNPKFYFDGIKMIDFKELNRLQKEIGYPITKI